MRAGVSTKKNFLVTGSNRSGSTWVGKVLASNRTVDTIIEPLNLNRVQRFRKFDLEYWYPKVTPDSSETLRQNVHDIVASYLNTPLYSPVSAMFRSYEGHSLFRSFKIRLRRALKPVKLLKDPTAIFSVPWLVDQFDLKAVILIRHPAAYVLSIKEKEWWFDFENLLNQKDFFTGMLRPLRTEVETYQSDRENRSIVENASLLWKVFYTRVLEYKQEHPEWYYCTHEALSLDPRSEFKKMFAYLDLEFNTDVEHFIESSTQATLGGEFVRDSRSNATKWQQKLNIQEQEQIRTITWDVAKYFYTDWE
jgi:hypothetical protein